MSDIFKDAKVVKVFHLVELKTGGERYLIEAKKDNEQLQCAPDGIYHQNAALRSQVEGLKKAVARSWWWYNKNDDEEEVVVCHFCGKSVLYDGGRYHHDKFPHKSHCLALQCTEETKSS